MFDNIIYARMYTYIKCILILPMPTDTSKTSPLLPKCLLFLYNPVSPFNAAYMSMGVGSSTRTQFSFPSSHQAPIALQRRLELSTSLPFTMEC